MEQISKTSIQATMFEFALAELIRNHRSSFQPLWSVDSWVKFLIWMSLNCGLSGERENLDLFVDSLGPILATRMRRIFFERTAEKFSLHIMADPADPKVLIMPIASTESLNHENALLALHDFGLNSSVHLDVTQWTFHSDLIAIPWKSVDSDR